MCEKVAYTVVLVNNLKNVSCPIKCSYKFIPSNIQVFLLLICFLIIKSENKKLELTSLTHDVKLV